MLNKRYKSKLILFKIIQILLHTNLIIYNRIELLNINLVQPNIKIKKWNCTVKNVFVYFNHNRFINSLLIQIKYTCNMCKHCSKSKIDAISVKHLNYVANKKHPKFTKHPNLTKHPKFTKHPIYTKQPKFTSFTCFKLRTNKYVLIKCFTKYFLTI